MPEASSQSKPECSTQTAEKERYLAASGFVSIDKYRAELEDIKLKGSKDNLSIEENRALRKALKAWDKKIVLSELGTDKDQDTSSEEASMQEEARKLRVDLEKKRGPLLSGCTFQLTQRSGRATEASAPPAAGKKAETSATDV